MKDTDSKKKLEKLKHTRTFVHFIWILSEILMVVVPIIIFVSTNFLRNCFFFLDTTIFFLLASSLFFAGLGDTLLKVTCKFDNKIEEAEQTMKRFR